MGGDLPGARGQHRPRRPDRPAQRRDRGGPPAHCTRLHTGDDPRGAGDRRHQDRPVRRDQRAPVHQTGAVAAPRTIGRLLRHLRPAHRGAGTLRRPTVAASLRLPGLRSEGRRTRASGRPRSQPAPQDPAALRLQSLPARRDPRAAGHDAGRAVRRRRHRQPRRRGLRAVRPGWRRERAPAPRTSRRRGRSSQRPPPGRHVRRPTPLRRLMEEVAVLGRHPLGRRRHRRGVALREEDRGHAAEDDQGRRADARANRTWHRRHAHPRRHGNPASHCRRPISIPTRICSTSRTGRWTCAPDGYGRTVPTTCLQRSAAPRSGQTPRRPSSSPSSIACSPIRPCGTSSPACSAMPCSAR